MRSLGNNFVRSSNVHGTARQYSVKFSALGRVKRFQNDFLPTLPDARNKVLVQVRIYVRVWSARVRVRVRVSCCHFAG